MPGIFLSYRRTDAEAWAGLLHKSLDERLPGVQVFRDIDNIPPGVKFADYIRDAVGSCDVLLAIIGPSWLTAADEGGRRRLDDERDFVRLEIATALERKIPIVPALVGGAVMPRRDALPAAIQDLADWQNHELPNRLWKESCDRLAASLKPLLSTTAPPTQDSPEPATASLTATGPDTPITKYKWLGVAGGVLVVVAGIVYFLQRPIHIKPEESRGAPIVAPPAVVVSGPEKTQAPTAQPPTRPVFPTPPLAGQWKFQVPSGTPAGKDEVAVDVRQQPDRIALFLVQSPAESEGITLELRPADRLIDGKIIGRGEVRGKVIMKMLKTNGGNAWEAKMLDLRDNKETEMFSGKGVVSADWRHWKGTIASPKGDDMTVAMELLEQDTLFVWTLRRGSQEEQFTFRKQHN